MAVVVKRHVTQQIFCLGPRKRNTSHDRGIGSAVELAPNNQRSHPSTYRTADSVARRLFKRSIHCPREPSDDALFALHSANTSHGDPLTRMCLNHASQAASPLSCVRLHFSSRITAVCVGNDSEDPAAVQLAADRKVLLASLNSCRRLQLKTPLVLDDARSEHLQIHADLLSAQEYGGSTSHLGSTSVRPQRNYKSQRTSLVQHERTSRLCSPPRMGALAVAEMWIGGKYRGHLPPSDTRSPLPSSSSDIQSARSDTPTIPLPTALSTTTRTGMHHRSDCDCHSRAVYDVLVLDKWKHIGIGRSADHRWIVEVAEESFVADAEDQPVAGPATSNDVGNDGVSISAIFSGWE